MRIVAGTLGGRVFDSPKRHRTHPMSEKVRGALFSMLGDIAGMTLLDAFAGSGGVSFEAISRGAQDVTAIEISKKVHKNIVENSRKLGISDQTKAIRANVSSWTESSADKRFDIVIADPPYDNLQLDTLQKLISHAKAKGIFVLSWPGKLRAPEFQYLERVNSKNYGDVQLLFYKKI